MRAVHAGRGQILMVLRALADRQAGRQLGAIIIIITHLAARICGHGQTARPREESCDNQHTAGAQRSAASGAPPRPAPLRDAMLGGAGRQARSAGGPAHEATTTAAWQ
jgi:hypothetical protein